MAAKTNLITAEEFAQRSGLTVKSVARYGAIGKIKRRSYKGKFKYYWGSMILKEAVYKCEECGESELKCGRMKIQKFIDETLVQLNVLIGCEC